MKNLVRFSILILVYYLMIGIPEIKAQDFQCSPAQTNITIPDNNMNLNLSENSVAVHPLNPSIILSANNQNYPPDVSAYVSTDWGVTWYSPYTNGIFDPTNSCCDPAAAIDLNGWLYVAYLGSGIKVARSQDMGKTWSIATVSNTGNVDKEHLKIDNSCNSIYKGQMYCAWDVGGTIKVSYSANSGTTWSSPATLSTFGYGHGVNIATDNSGNVYVVWAIHNTMNQTWDVLHFTKSTDGGSTWSTPSTISLLPYTALKSISGVGPSMTVNMQDNTIYLVYSGKVIGQENYDVYLKKSADGGASWSAETLVNQNQSGGQTFPWISCDPMTGYLACIYYDTRENGTKHAYVSISTNSGTIWCDMKVSIVDVVQATGNASDYIGIEFNKGIVYPIWTRSAVNFTYRTQIYPFDVIQRDLIVHDENYSGFNLTQSANSITAYNITLLSGSNVTYETVNSITLLPGFITNDNSVFIADVFHCEGYTEAENIALYEQVKPNEKDNTAPLEFSLSQNYPNPFNPTTSIKYSLKQDSWVTIIVYNILGQEVKRLIDRYEDAGFRSVVWDGTNNYGSQVSTGIYFYKLTAGEFTEQKKMVIIR